MQDQAHVRSSQRDAADTDPNDPGAYDDEDF